MSTGSCVDVLVAGAGLPGLACASALARQGLAVALCDRAPVKTAAPEADLWDSRVYAVSPGSATFLATLSAWQELGCERIAPVEAMAVAGDAGGSLTFSAYELGARALAWIVEESALRNALVASVHAAGVRILPPCAFANLEFAAEKASLTFADGSAQDARLVVGADGLRSWVRAAAGIAAQPEAYAQTALVANFTTEHEPRGVARQWFLAQEGVLAFLPLPGRRVSIVWSAPVDLAVELLALSPGALATRVAQAGGHALGQLSPLTPAAAFPLAYLRLASLTAPRLALVGDAGHGIHPLAGQGVNLGFGDAAALADVLSQRGPVTDAGSPLLLDRYARRRAEPILAAQAVTDGLSRLFGVDRPWLARLRNHGMATIDRFPAVKRALAQPALR